jgi:transcription-repair coupling factor (superfamily II helicase)
MDIASKSLPMGTEAARLKAALQTARPLTLASVPEGYAGKVLADLVSAVDAWPAVFVAREGQRLAEVERALRFFAPDIELLNFPAWDCLPYDRVSPHPAIVAERMATLARLGRKPGRPAIVLTTVNAALQRVPTRDFVARGSFSGGVGNQIRMDDLVRWLEDNGFLRSATVREAGEYAVRGAP